MKLSKTTYLHSFTLIVLILGIIRFFSNFGSATVQIESNDTTDSIGNNSVILSDTHFSASSDAKENIERDTREPHKIYSVPRYDDAFPDANDVQLEAAKKWGVKPVADNDDAENRKSELVYVASCPWYHVDKLRSSSPYLVPRAAILLQDIGRNFLDSLDIKGIPLHKIIATSVLRTKENVSALRTRNMNATENSCHLYATTFDICYNRYETVENPKGPKRRQVTNDTLKWILSEVLRDMRQDNRCYVKYEVKQGCFHITTR